jgi:murein L,D-transpeptidase YcbB/YkuD
MSGVVQWQEVSPLHDVRQFPGCRYFPCNVWGMRLFPHVRQIASIASTLSVALAIAACSRAPSTTPELQALVARATPPSKSISRDVWSATQAFYASRDQEYAWVAGDGPDEHTLQALNVLTDAAAHGLNPADYGEPELRALAERFATTNRENSSEAQPLAELDVRLTASLLQLGGHVAVGRLSPKTIDSRWNARRQAPDYVDALQQAANKGIDGFLAAIQPRHPEYQKLVSAMKALRVQAGEGWTTVPRATLKVGHWNAAVVPLRQRLATSGALPEGASLDSPQFDADVERGLRVFQEHHTLPATGTLDPATLHKLNVPIETRVQQVAINLERWRWLPDDLGARHFIINVPYFHLIAREAGTPVLDIRVVVGKRGNETPLFSDEMETVVFSPYWNVPDTIALEETAPAAARDPGFLDRNNMEIVDKRGRVVSSNALPWGDEGALRAYRFRQRPGAANALGFVKFLFPNQYAVYLHDTPADALFQRIGRAFSHGCVRVEEPETLAQYVLRDQPEWTADAIRTAMRSGNERHVKLSQPIAVHIVYFTAWVDDSGGLHFQDDVYGYDARQDRL